MSRLLARRLAGAMLLLFGVATLLFVLLHALPAGPATPPAGADAAPPLALQFVRYLTALLQGDFGRSPLRDAEIGPLIAGHLATTLVLLAVATALVLVLGLPLGMIGARPGGRIFGGGFFGTSAALAAAILACVPPFAAALSIFYAVAATRSWLPAGGPDGAGHLLVPALALGLTGAGWTALSVRSALIRILAEPHILSAEARGLPARRVLLRHALPGALARVGARAGAGASWLVSGAVLVEAVFGRPGIGRLAWEAITQRDAPLLAGIALTGAGLVVAAGLVGEVAAARLDRRRRAPGTAVR